MRLGEVIVRFRYIYPLPLGGQNELLTVFFTGSFEINQGITWKVKWGSSSTGPSFRFLTHFREDPCETHGGERIHEFVRPLPEGTIRTALILFAVNGNGSN